MREILQPDESNNRKFKAKRRESCCLGLAVGLTELQPKALDMVNGYVLVRERAG